jgi:hypothetical protein
VDTQVRNCSHKHRSQYRREEDREVFVYTTCLICNKFLGKTLAYSPYKQIHQQTTVESPPPRREQTEETVVDRITSYNQAGVG